MRRWFLIGFALIALMGLMGCKETDTQKTMQQEKDARISFQPYSDIEVPRLKELIQRKGFKQYVSKQPYILGYSYDGTYLALIINEKKTEAFRIEIYHTGQNRIVATAYVPAPGSEVSQDTSAREEQLQATQEAIDMGFQIKVQVEPELLVPNKKKNPKNSPWSLTALWDGSTYKLVGEDSLGNKWQLAEEVIEDNKAEFSSEVQLFSHPQFPKRQTAVAAVNDPETGLRPLVFTVNTDKWDKSWSDHELNKVLKKWLPPSEGKVVYRGRSGNGTPDSLLAVAGEEKSSKSGSNLLYRGIVQQFVMLSSEQKARIHGGKKGLFYKEQSISPKSRQVEAYGLLLIERDTNIRERFLIIDELDSSGDIIQTYEWVWNVEDKEFRLVGENT